MKVLFLDIDGVLNREGTQERVGMFVGVDRYLSEMFLAWLAQYPEVNVVLSSSWRKPNPHVDLEGELARAGITYIDKTPISYGEERGHQISAWLALHPEVTHYVILDDRNDMVDVLPFLVQTEEPVGITHAHLEAARRLLELAPST